MFDLKGYGWMLLDGLQLTLLVGICAMLVAIALGLIAAWGKLSQSKTANIIAGAYTTVVRGIPELILLLLIYYGVPTAIQDIATGMGYDIRIDLNSFLAGTLTIGLVYGAFATEVFRGAIQAVPKGQLEAAKAIGMQERVMVRRILLPQMWRYALPGLGNVWMVLLKSTALISIIQLDEIMRKAHIAAGATHKPFTFFFLASLLYLSITLVSVLAQQYAESWASRGIMRAD